MAKSSRVPRVAGQKRRPSPSRPELVRPRVPRWISHLGSVAAGATVVFITSSSLPAAWTNAQRAVGRGDLAISVLAGADYPGAPVARYIWPPGTLTVPEGASADEAQDARALEGESTAFRLSINSTFDERVTIQRWQLKVLDRQQPPSGLVAQIDGLGGEDTVRYLTIDLDTGGMLWQSTENATPKAVPPPLFVNADEGEIVDVTGTTHLSLVRWQLALTYTVGNSGPRTVLVHPQSGAFVTAAVRNSAVVGETGCHAPSGASADLCSGVTFESFDPDAEAITP